MRPGSQNPVARGSSVKSGFTPGGSKAGKASYAVTGGPGDSLGGPQPVPAPSARPHPSAPPGVNRSAPGGVDRSAPGPMPAPHAPHPAAATGGRMPAEYQLPPGTQAGPAYQPPGVQQHDLLAMLLAALRPPDEF